MASCALKNSRLPTRKPSITATPPPRGTGVLCKDRWFGLSCGSHLALRVIHQAAKAEVRQLMALTAAIDRSEVTAGQGVRKNW